MGEFLALHEVGEDEDGKTNKKLSATLVEQTLHRWVKLSNLVFSIDAL